MKYNPLAYLREQNSIFGQAARFRWDSGVIPKDILPQQNVKGNWNNSVFDTIRYLYYNSFFYKKPGSLVLDSLNWLLEYDHKPMEYQCNDGCSYDNLFFRTSRLDNQKVRKLKGLPFSNGCSGFVKTGAVLYLAAHYGLLEDERVVKAYKTLNELPRSGRTWYCSPSCGNNLFQAIVKHPIYSVSKVMNITLGYLKNHQLDNGSWDRGIPFFPVFNALANLPQNEAGRIFDKAQKKLISSQNKDGSWGRTDKDLKTYLVLDALEKKEIKINI